MSAVDVDALLGCLALDDLGNGVLRGANLDIGYHRVFGGQILGQIIAAAAATLPDKSVKSLSVTFPREGNAALPMDYRVTVHQDGRTFATIGVIGFQVDPASGADKTVTVAVVSMHVDEEGPHHSAGAPPVGSAGDAAPRVVDLIPWEVRAVDDVDLHDRAAGPPTYQWWTRATTLDDPSQTDRPRWIDQALLAHATDLTVIGTALRPIDGLSEADSMTKITTAVTTHSLWFHQPFHLDDWLLVSQTGPVVAHGRAFGRGDVFQGDQLVASFAQESMIRPIPAR